MRLANVPVSLLLAIAGGTYVAGVLVLIRSGAPLGSATFFAVAAAMTGAYGLLLARVWNARDARRGLLAMAFAMAVVVRVPLAIAQVGPDSDMVRYLWDGRLRSLGYNPYHVVPSDPALAHTHTAETAGMPSEHDRTPYPPAAQAFFRLVVALGDSTLAMKLAIVACDLLTALLLWRWLAETGRNQWLMLAYAWHPLVILEVAHSGHIDALAALWVTAAAYWLARRRTALASLAFALAVTSKLLPIVLAPLFFRRVPRRDVVLAGAFVALLYFPFMSGGLPLGSLGGLVAGTRFNGPVFLGLERVLSAPGAAVMAVLLGLCAAAWARWRLDETDPAAWAWPMAVALAAAPVVYPWYLLCLTPFLTTVSTLPLTVWTFSVVPVYLVWHFSRLGGPWAVPTPILLIEYGLLVAACIALVAWYRRRRAQLAIPDSYPS